MDRQEGYPQQEANWEDYHHFQMFQLSNHQAQQHYSQQHHFMQHPQQFYQQGHYPQQHGTSITAYQGYQTFYQSSTETDWNMTGRANLQAVPQAVSTNSSAESYLNQNIEVRDKTSSTSSSIQTGSYREEIYSVTPALEVSSPACSIQSISSNDASCATKRGGRGGNSTRKRPATGDLDEDERIGLKRIANAKHQRVNRAQLKATNEVEREKNQLIERLFDQIEEIETRRVEDLQRASSDNRRRREELEEELERLRNDYLLEIRNAVRDTKRAYRAKDRDLVKRKEAIKVEENHKMHMKIAEEKEAKMRMIQEDQMSRVSMDNVC